jgi:hypothetical protein
MTIRPLYFQDETIWRGRMLVAVDELKCAVLALGALISAIYMISQIVAIYPSASVRAFMIVIVGIFGLVGFGFKYLDELQGLKRIEHDIMKSIDDPE